MKKLKFWNMMIIIAMALPMMVACGGSDDDSPEETTLYVSLETPSGTRLNGYVYVFPNASDYDPETFTTTGGVFANPQATIKRKNGTTVDSYAFIPCTKEELGVWHHYDHEPSQSWMHGCNPGTYYMIATRPGWGLMAWMSKTVNIKANTIQLEKFIFTVTDGYQGQ